MSLNSYVTMDGHEIATAQALQARACMIDPDVRMNPVLVKPSSDVTGQIIINGKPAGKINASAYFDYRQTALDAIRKSYDSLSEEYEVVIIEGAGSPAEVNLKKNDITNMNMALYAEAPVLIAGDIDRGGVFASFIGSMETFTEPERKLVAGFIVNKFRGDAALLKDAFDYVEKHTGRKTLGVIPYIKDLRLPEEDSVNLSDSVFNTGKSERNAEAEIDICIINLPHFSNFTDFDAFQVEPDVIVRLADCPEDIFKSCKYPDAVVIPGTRNVIGDLVFLEKTGLASAIKKIAVEGKCWIIGICGGYQMLGNIVEDPFNI
jgi:cobyric acid synthase CobQ